MIKAFVLIKTKDQITNLYFNWLYLSDNTCFLPVSMFKEGEHRCNLYIEKGMVGFSCWIIEV